MAKSPRERRRPTATPQAAKEPIADRILAPPKPPFHSWTNWQGLVLIAVVAAAMATWTWGTWPDVLIDFGVERYIPWRLAEGEVLYRDISFHNGPLSQYFNALCFRVFGSSLRTLVFCNLALLAVLISLLYHMLRQISCRLAATAACLVFVLLFAFAQFVGIGNYNYVCPYAHEMTHGLLLALVALAAAWPPGCCILRYVLSGLALGLTFLTKSEIFFAAALAIATAVPLGLVFERPGWGRALARLGCFSLAVVTPPLIAFVCLAFAMPAHQAWLGTLGSWVVAARSDIRELPFYRAVQGTDQPWDNILAMLRMTGLYAVILLPAGVLGLALRRAGQYRTAIAAGVFAATAALLWFWRAEIDWDGLARPLPLLILATILAVAVCFWPHRREEGAQRRFVCQVSLLVFALALLAKIVLNARIFHYGFVLAMPGTLVLVVAAFDWAPALIERRGGFGWVFAAAAAALLAVTASLYLTGQSFWIGQKSTRVGAGGDEFWADARGRFVAAAVEQIAARSSPGMTLAVLPEGAMINCLAGLRNPTSHINFMPVELMLFGEDQIVECFQAHPPDLIALVHKDTSEIGFRFFGRDYGRRLGDWIRANYRPFCLIGAEPLQTDKFGILLLEKDKGRKKSSEPRRSGAGVTPRSLPLPLRG